MLGSEQTSRVWAQTTPPRALQGPEVAAEGAPEHRDPLGSWEVSVRRGELQVVGFPSEPP